MLKGFTSSEQKMTHILFYFKGFDNFEVNISTEIMSVQRCTMKPL